MVRAAKRLGVPLCLEVNAPLAYERNGEQDERLVFRGTAARLESWIPTHADHTVVVSTPLKQYLESVGVPKDKCIVMPNGVDPERFRPKAKNDELQRKVGIPADAFVIGFTGILRPWHGLDLLLGALEHLKQQNLDVALLIDRDDAVHNMVQYGPHPLFSMPQFIFGALPVGDVSPENSFKF